MPCSAVSNLYDRDRECLPGVKDRVRGRDSEPRNERDTVLFRLLAFVSGLSVTRMSVSLVFKSFCIREC